MIVTSKLLTGFDAPILQAMYLDKPMKDHNLLQAICRVNRTYGQTKTHGLIVDYIGIFDDVAQALDFDEKAVQQVVSNIDELRKALPVQMQKCLAFFPNVDRSVGGYEGLMAAQQCLPDNATRDKFAAEYSVLGTIWEALSPDPCLSAYAKDFKWLTQVYESVKPVSGNGRLLWHRLGAKTIELINENVHVEAVSDDIEALVLDADVLDGILKDANPSKKAREVEIKLIARLKKHAGNPKFKELGERLEKIREKHEQGLLNSLEFDSLAPHARVALRASLRSVCLASIGRLGSQRHPRTRQGDRGSRKAGGARRRTRPRLVRPDRTFQRSEGQAHARHRRAHRGRHRRHREAGPLRRLASTAQGEREVKQALRRALLKYKLHNDQELFDKAYGYIRQYY